MEALRELLIENTQTVEKEAKVLGWQYLLASAREGARQAAASTSIL